ncbi:hypothetical protein QO058_20500 [Bosea vestrisii]|uniref:hypothetical protein n=1 Tax=Bosea vestrisii TaxID=151416 RepID=UPI0024DFFD35|nr:hypothetical protein [Bosea vestrisii]WID95162.1 hypothetical protein QO058_20500 [Bosea vestrisii]
MSRAYYAQRKGKISGQFDFLTLRQLAGSVFHKLKQDGFFDESFGFYCVDAGSVPGKLGQDVEFTVHLRLGKPDLWPFVERVYDYDEDDLFSVMEFLYDHVSKPIKGQMHDFGNCGMHWDEFDVEVGRKAFREQVNLLLARYGDGYELSSDGEILELGPAGVAPLLKADIPIADGHVHARLQSAITKFRERKSTPDDRRDVIRDLADVLEYLRPQLKKVLTKKDEADLFQIANEFGIRHHNPSQKTNYDPNVWLSWMFYYYLATIHAGIRLVEKAEANAPAD